jgi:hypothetical protein
MNNEGHVIVEVDESGRLTRLFVRNDYGVEIDLPVIDVSINASAHQPTTLTLTTFRFRTPSMRGPI